MTPLRKGGLWLLAAGVALSLTSSATPGRVQALSRGRLRVWESLGMGENEGPWFTTFHCEGMLPWQAEHYEVPLRIGEGFLDSSSDYRRFRVVDIWYSTDKHGVFDRGRHVFLKDVTETEEDRLFLMEPAYFRRSDED